MQRYEAHAVEDVIEVNYTAQQNVFGERLLRKQYMYLIDTNEQLVQLVDSISTGKIQYTNLIHET